MVTLAPGSSPAQLPPVAIIDYYGLQTIPRGTVAAALGLVVGDSVPRDVRPIIGRLEAIPGVAVARLEIVCCERGGSLVYVGIIERGATLPRFRASPTGAARLPADVIAAGARFEAAHEAAVLAGRANENTEAGHSLMEDSLARSIQQEFVAFAERDRAVLARVLRTSSAADERALAAQVIAYASDKRAMIPLLVDALSDPHAAVRNNAIRALALIAGLAARRPELGLAVSPAPFIALLRSPYWTDRNKASLALLSLTDAREPAVLAALRATALPELREMAAWRAQGHAFPARVILGRIEGRSDEEIFKALSTPPTR